MLERRYSEFHSFREGLQLSYKSLEIEQLPPKTWLFSPLDDASGFLSARREGLAKWLDSLLSNLNSRGLLASPAVSDFLDINHISKR